MFKTCKKPPMSIISASGSICTFNALQAGIPLKSCVSQISGYQEGTGTPSPSNVRNLVSFSSGTLTATGKNLFCKTATNTANGFVDNSMLDTDGAITSNTSYCISEYIPVRGGENITIQGLIGDRVYVCYYNANKEYIGQGRYSRYTERTYSLPSTTAYIRASVPKANIDIFQIEYGDIATSYQEYGNTYTFTFGQSIYKGSIDWKRGVVTGTHLLFIVDDTNSWEEVSSGKYMTSNVFPTYVLKINPVGVNISNLYIFLGSGTTNSASMDTDHRFYLRTQQGRILIYDSDYPTLNDFKTMLSNTPLTVAYELATPIEIQLSGIQIENILGNNNIFADCGSTALEAIKIGR